MNVEKLVQLTYYLLQKYDMRPNEVEEAKQELALMVQEFCKTYKREGLRE